jgi:hypothetical protein
MWEAFMRGNWPAAALAADAERQAREEMAETRPGARHAHAKPAARAGATISRMGTGRGLAGRLAAALGGALLVTAVLPAAALAGDTESRVMVPGPFCGTRGFVRFGSPDPGQPGRIPARLPAI